jgi:O-antigen/teichoic acid export membrane protein
MTQPATFAGQSTSPALVVKSSGLHSQGESIKKHVKNGFAYSGLVSLPIFFDALAMSGALMSVIFGPTAHAGAGALVGLAVYQVFRSYSYPLGSVINGTDRPDILTKARAVTIIIHAPLARILIQSQGLVGAVIATADTEACRLCMMYIFVVQVKESPGLSKKYLNNYLQQL